MLETGVGFAFWLFLTFGSFIHTDHNFIYLWFRNNEHPKKARIRSNTPYIYLFRNYKIIVLNEQVSL